MPISTSDFVAVADKISDVGSGSEMFDRSAVSRYYYCAHHEAKQFLQTRHQVTDFSARDDPVRGGRLNSHGVIVLLLSEHVGREVGDLMSQFKQKRELADYDLRATWDSNECARAKQLLQHLRRQVFGTA